MMLALVLTWGASVAALVTGHGLTLPLTIVPLAGFAAGFTLARDWVRQREGRRVAVTAIMVVVAGVAAGLWSTFDGNDYRAFLVFIGMMATVCPLVTGLGAGAWSGAMSRS